MKLAPKSGAKVTKGFAKVTKGLIKVTKGFAKVTKSLIKVTKGFAKVRNGKLIDMFKERYCIDGVETHCIIEAICCGSFSITFCNYPLINVVGKINFFVEI